MSDQEVIRSRSRRSPCTVDFGQDGVWQVTAGRKSVLRRSHTRFVFNQYPGCTLAELEEKGCRWPPETRVIDMEWHLMGDYGEHIHENKVYLRYKCKKCEFGRISLRVGAMKALVAANKVELLFPKNGNGWCYITTNGGNDWTHLCELTTTPGK